MLTSRELLTHQSLVDLLDQISASSAFLNAYMVQSKEYVPFMPFPLGQRMRGVMDNVQDIVREVEDIRALARAGKAFILPGPKLASGRVVQFRKRKPAKNHPWNQANNAFHEEWVAKQERKKAGK